MAAHQGDPRPHVVSQRPDLQRLRHREREAEAGTHVELPELRTRHDRNLRAAINLRNLIMPAGRSRDGPGQEAVVQNKPWDSSQGEPGFVKNEPPLRECGLGTDAGTEVEGPARGSWNNRAPNAAINPSNFVIPSGRHRDGRGRKAVVPEQGPLASCQGQPGSVKGLPHLRGRRREPGAGLDPDKQRPQAPGVDPRVAGP